MNGDRTICRGCGSEDLHLMGSVRCERFRIDRQTTELLARFPLWVLYAASIIAVGIRMKEWAIIRAQSLWEWVLLRFAA